MMAVYTMVIATKAEKHGWTVKAEPTDCLRAWIQDGRERPQSRIRNQGLNNLHIMFKKNPSFECK